MTDSFIVYPCGVHHDPDALQWDSASHISILIFQSNNIEKFLYLKIPLHVLTPNTRELDTTLVVALLGGSVETCWHALTDWVLTDWGLRTLSSTVSCPLPSLPTSSHASLGQPQISNPRHGKIFMKNIKISNESYYLIKKVEVLVNIPLKVLRSFTLHC